MRRLFVAGVLALSAAAPVAAAAQSRVAHVAVLTIVPVSSPLGMPGWRAFTGALQKRGWVEGRNLVFEIRVAGGRAERYRQFAAELVALRPDVIVGVTTQGVEAAR